MGTSPLSTGWRPFFAPLTRAGAVYGAKNGDGHEASEA